jgi:hypothetical protein
MTIENIPKTIFPFYEEEKAAAVTPFNPRDQESLGNQLVFDVNHDRKMFMLRGNVLLDFMFCQFTQLFRQYMRGVSGLNGQEYFRFYINYLREAADHHYAGKPLSREVEKLVYEKLGARQVVFPNIKDEIAFSSSFIEMLYPDPREFCDPLLFSVYYKPTIIEVDGHKEEFDLVGLTSSLYFGDPSNNNLTDSEFIEVSLPPEDPPLPSPRWSLSLGHLIPYFRK